MSFDAFLLFIVLLCVAAGTVLLVAKMEER